MTHYSACVGCIKQGKPCETRDALKERIAGLGITSVKWRCRDRVPKFQAGDPVWVDTVAGYGGEHLDDCGEPYRDYFAGHSIHYIGPKWLVYIDPGSPGRDHDDIEFDANANGFCKIPAHRISKRDGAQETICPECELPAYKGHQQGYSCAYREEQKRRLESISP